MKFEYKIIQITTIINVNKTEILTIGINIYQISVDLHLFILKATQDLKAPKERKVQEEEQVLRALKVLGEIRVYRVHEANQDAQVQQEREDLKDYVEMWVLLDH